MKKQSTADLPSVLRACGYKATPPRLAILKMLKEAKKPMSPHAIIEKLHRMIDQATIYRSLKAFKKSGIIKQIDLHHNHPHYELTEGQDHHHHIVCKNCGTIEDIEMHDTKSSEKGVLEKSKKFASIQNHALEFFGTCKACAKHETK